MSSENNSHFQLSEIFNVKGKVALVTGGGSGIGLMATQALAVNGAKVYIVGRTKEKLDTVVQKYGHKIAGEIIPLVGDVTKKDGVEQLVKEIESREKCLCILVNNAGIAASQVTPPKNADDFKKNMFDTADVEEWTSVYATNVVGPYLMATAFLPLLQRATETHHGFSGTIINITSISGLPVVKISQNQFPYNASKGALVHLNKMLSAEVVNAGLKVRVNAIAPGVFPSEMTTGDSGENQKSSMPKEQKGQLPSGRPGNDRDMAAAVLFAASCQYLNGQNIPVDGGYLIQTGQ
ncbi:short chain dehydrogenase/reductase [Mycena galericulata]|nr:short chain dehydrogenase/reductase [Mycena galericulata]